MIPCRGSTFLVKNSSAKVLRQDPTQCSCRTVWKLACLEWNEQEGSEVIGARVVRGTVESLLGHPEGSGHWLYSGGGRKHW